MSFWKLQLFLIIKSFSTVFKPSIDYSSHSSPLEEPMEVREEKDSVPLVKMSCLLFSTLVSLQERHVCSER